MQQRVVLFEDHTAQRLRPLAWTVPTYEVPVGAWTLRERVAAALEPVAGARLELWPRSLLAPLQRRTVPPGVVVGPEEGETAGGTVLLLSGRLLGTAADLAALLADGPPAAWRDDAGWLALRIPAADLPAVRDDWRAWERRQAAAGAWVRDSVPAEPWDPPAAASLPAPGDPPAALGWLWDVVPAIPRLLAEDVAALATAAPRRRHLFGVVPEAAPAWLVSGPWTEAGAALPGGAVRLGEHPVWLGPDVSLAPGVVIDTRHGPVALDGGVEVLPGAYLAGPLWLGAGTRVKAHATIYGETAAGPNGRLAGEIAESQLAPLVNKQHAGFLGHAVIGSWVNLGADTTCSDLKNNYGEIKVNFGLGPVNTGRRFVGLMMAEHAKSAIGTTFNTGTTVGVASNVFAAGFPRSFLPNFTWGDGRGRTRFQVERALETAAVVMSRRGCRLVEEHADLLRALAAGQE